MTGAERKESIIKTAIRLFAEKGFQATTTRELAAAVGVTEPVLYQHFATKGDLYAGIIETICGQEKKEDARLEAASAAEDDEAFFSRLGELILEWYDNEPEVARLLLFSALEKHELKDRFFEREVSVLYERLTEYIERRQRKGIFRKMDSYLAARAFAGGFIHQGMAQTVYGLNDFKRTRAEVVKGIVDVFLNGMKKPRRGAR